jgi:hypothetical protein
LQQQEREWKNKTQSKTQMPMKTAHCFSIVCTEKKEKRKPQTQKKKPTTKGKISLLGRKAKLMVFDVSELR